MKSLCDLFNDVANVQTYALKIDVPTLNEQGLTWMLHKLHILINRMPEQGENVTLETWPSGIDRLFAIRDFRMVAGEEVLLRATSEWMVIDVNRRRPVRLPACVTETAAFCVDGIREIPFELDTKKMPTNFENPRRFTATYDNIDFNKHAIEASAHNFTLNGEIANIAKCRHRGIADDAFHAMNELEKAGERFGIVIVDPPSFAKSLSERAQAMKSYSRLAVAAVRLLSKNGILVFASCSSRIGADELFDEVHRAAADAGRPLKEFDRRAEAPDHPALFKESHYLKCLYAYV